MDSITFDGVEIPVTAWAIWGVDADGEVIAVQVIHTDTSQALAERIADGLRAQGADVRVDPVVDFPITEADIDLAAFDDDDGDLADERLTEMCEAEDQSTADRRWNAWVRNHGEVLGVA